MRRSRRTQTLGAVNPRATSPLLLACLALAASACVVSVDDGSSSTGGGGSGGGETEPGLTTADKLDLLFVVDNSIGMADKQAVLASAVPDLVARLLSPRCIDASGAPAATQPTSASEACPAGYEREIQALTDIHVGVISSSLGALTAGQCDGNPGFTGDGNDRARLLSRTENGSPVATFEDKGFLSWGPSGLNGGSGDANALVSSVADLIVGARSVGCGYEMPLEAMLRFLVDPQPYESLTRDGAMLVKQGVDSVLLQQRADFLRPDSMLAVVVLSDENDCSVAVESQGFLVFEPAPFYRSTNACSADPNDACCTSCFGGGEIEGCPSAAENGCTTEKYTAQEDHPNLRCFNQKQRYGASFLYPTQRYVNALSQRRIDPSRADLSLSGGAGVDNPLFSDLGGQNRATRGPELVRFVSVVGVPWQAIAPRDAGGAPTLAEGFERVEELEAKGALAALVGDPDANLKPSDPFMIESVTQRTGTSALTGASLPGANDVNGNDRSILGGDDLQYACAYALAEPLADGMECVMCTEASCDNPLCDGTTQLRAKAYPGLRELAVTRGLGAQGVAASICPAQLDDPSAADYGHRPMIESLLRSFRGAL
jgi:hypothetical protein